MPALPTFENIIWSRKGSTLTLTLNRPDKLNAFNAELFGDLADAVEAASADDTIRVVVFTGAGRAFCAGADLTSVSGYHAGAEDGALARGVREAQGVFDRVEALPMPTIAAINGHAVGAGPLEGVTHGGVVHVVRAGRGDVDAVQGKPQRLGLGLDERLPHAVHRRPSERLGDRGEQSDDLPLLLDAVSTYGFERMGKREVSRAFRWLTEAKPEKLQSALEKSLKLIDLAVSRESGAVRSVIDIYSGSDEAEQVLQDHLEQWSLYGDGLRDRILEYGMHRARQLNTTPPEAPVLDEKEQAMSGVVPSVHPDVRGREFYPERTGAYRKYTKENPDSLKGLKLNRNLQRTILNYIDGKRSIPKIRRFVEAETGANLPLDRLLAYLEFLRSIKWIED